MVRTMTKPTSLTFRHITSKALERAKLTTAYALLERDLFRAHGPTAVRRLTDDERRQLARLGHDIGWRRLSRVAVKSVAVSAATSKMSIVRLFR